MGVGDPQRIVLLLALGDDVEPFLCRLAEAVDGVVDAFDGFFQCAHHGLVGAEAFDFAQLGDRRGLGGLEVLGVLDTGRVIGGCQQRRPL